MCKKYRVSAWCAAIPVGQPPPEPPCPSPVSGWEGWTLMNIHHVLEGSLRERREHFCKKEVKREK